MRRLLVKTIGAWPLGAAMEPAARRRYRLGLVLYLIGLRRLGVRVSGVPTGKRAK